MKTVSKEKIGFDMLIYALYVALLPFDQILNFSGSGTVTKFLGMVVIAAMWVRIILTGQHLSINYTVFSFIFFFLWCFLTVIWGLDETSLPITLISLYAMLVTCSTRGFNKREVNFIANVMIVSAVYLAGRMILNPDSYSGIRGTVVSEAGEADPNTISTNLSLAAILAFGFGLESKKATKRIIYLCCGVFFILGMLLTGSRTGLLAFFIGMFYVLFKKSKEIGKGKILLRTAVIFFVCIFVVDYAVKNNILNISLLERLSVESTQDSGGGGRFSYWLKLIDVILDNPLRAIFGFGSNTSNYVAYKFLGHGGSTHNIFLEYTITTGIIGLVLLCNILVKSFKKAKSDKNLLLVGMLVACIVSCFTINFFHSKVLWNVLCLIWSTNISNVFATENIESEDETIQARNKLI